MYFFTLFCLWAFSDSVGDRVFRNSFCRIPLRFGPCEGLVAPYCAIPRDYLQRYPPSLRAVGFLVSRHGQLGAIPPPPFLSISPLESMQSGGAIPLPPPPQKGYLSDTCAIPYENKAMGATPPSAILSRKGIARYGGGISHWAAKCEGELLRLRFAILVRSAQKCWGCRGGDLPTSTSRAS